jgi:hypothetical protein
MHPLLGGAGVGFIVASKLFASTFSFELYRKMFLHFFTNTITASGNTSLDFTTVLVYSFSK